MLSQPVHPLFHLPIQHRRASGTSASPASFHRGRLSPISTRIAAHPRTCALHGRGCERTPTATRSTARASPLGDYRRPPSPAAPTGSRASRTAFHTDSLLYDSLAVMLPGTAEHDHQQSISVSNLVSSTTRLQPITLRQVRPQACSARWRRPERPSELVPVRNVRRELLAQGCPPAHTRPAARRQHPLRGLQRIGATGLLRGVGTENVGWSNQTWFHYRQKRRGQQAFARPAVLSTRPSTSGTLSDTVTVAPKPATSSAGSSPTQKVDAPTWMRCRSRTSTPDREEITRGRWRTFRPCGRPFRQRGNRITDNPKTNDMKRLLYFFHSC